MRVRYSIPTTPFSQQTNTYAVLQSLNQSIEEKLRLLQKKWFNFSIGMYLFDWFIDIYSFSCLLFILKKIFSWKNFSSFYIYNKQNSSQINTAHEYNDDDLIDLIDFFKFLRFHIHFNRLLIWINQPSNWFEPYITRHLTFHARRSFPLIAIILATCLEEDTLSLSLPLPLAILRQIAS